MHSQTGTKIFSFQSSMSDIWLPLTQNVPALGVRLLYFQGGKGQHFEHVHVIYFGLSSPTWVHPYKTTVKVEETKGCIHHD